MSRTVLVVDDHVEFRKSVRDLLEADEFHVVGEAGSGVDALDAVVNLCPDVVLLDIRLPGLDGIEVAVLVALMRNPPAVVLVSSRDRAVFGRRLVNAPVRGFLAKSELTGAALRRILD